MEQKSALSQETCRVLLEKFLVSKTLSLPKSLREHSISGLFYRLQLAFWYRKDHLLPPVLESSSAKSARKKYNQQEFTFFYDFIQQTQLPPLYGRSKTDLRLLYDQFCLHIEEIPVAGMILLTQDKQCLIVQSRASRKWGLPKGKEEEEETSWQTAQREVKEETGLNIRCCQDKYVDGDKIKGHDIIVRAKHIKVLRFPLRRDCTIPSKPSKTKTKSQSPFTIVTPASIFIVELPFCSQDIVPLLQKASADATEIAESKFVPLHLLIARSDKEKEKEKEQTKSKSLPLTFRDRKILRRFAQQYQQ